MFISFNKAGLRQLLTSSIILVFHILVPTGANDAGKGTVDDLEIMFEKLEMDISAFAREMENLTLPVNKCSEDTIRACSEGSYHSCDSQLPYASCPGNDYAVETCGKGNEGGCGALFDFTSSTVSVAPRSSNRHSLDVDDRIKDVICSSLPAEDYVIGVTKESLPYWNSFSVNPPWLYFGSEDGVFRFLPGTPNECPGGKNEYDPTIRPWYVAASSGPKDVVLILDTSGSMENAGRLSIMQEAAKRVVNTLGISDYFAIVEFNDRADILEGSDDNPLLQRATTDNKQRLMKKIDGLAPGGGTDFSSGFDLAFDIFKASERNEMSTSCHKAILFLTDGAMGDDEASFFNLLNERLGEYEEGNLPIIFTYSFGSGADETVPKRIACDYRGIWSDIKDGGNLGEAMGAYYKYFAYGLSADPGTDDFDLGFVAWTEPYEFSIGVGLGITASAPVYDRSVDPPILVGVVGGDISFAAMERALDKKEKEARDAVITKIVERSGASCQRLDLTDCQLESLRGYRSSDKKNQRATCGSCENSNIKPLKSILCESVNYPDDIWNNRFNQERTYEERACCKVGAEPRGANEYSYDEIVADHVCVEKSKTGLIVGITFAGALVVAIAGYFILKFVRSRKMKRKKFTIDLKAKGGEEAKFPLKLEDRDVIVVMPPPTAPLNGNERI